MKRTRRISAVLLAMIMSVSVCLPTNAAESLAFKPLLNNKEKSINNKKGAVR